MAGEYWLSFMDLHPDISIRKPEAMSLPELLDLVKFKYQNFFDFLCNLIVQNNLQARQIYNYDETSISTVQTLERS